MKFLTVRSSPPSNSLLPRQATSTSSTCITSCPQLAACPPSCPVGQMCSAIPRTCNDCGGNVCSPDPDYKRPSKKSSPIGGVIGAILAVLVVLAIGYWFWNRRKKKILEGERRKRNEEKVREAGVGFRPKRKSEGSGSGTGSGGVAIEMNDHLKKRSVNSSNKSNGGTDTDGMEEEIIMDETLDEDTEWTEMRSDGLTVYKKPAGSPQEEEYQIKRYSSGAATHLSRITEGNEDDEMSIRRASTLHPSVHNIPPLPGKPQSGLRNHSHSSSINLDPLNKNATRSRKSSPNSQNPFSDPSSNYNISSSPTITQPSPVHRPVGAPLVDLSTGKVPSRRGSGVPSVGSSNSSNDHGNSSNSGHSASGMNRTLLSPSMPSRPSRAPDLNLRLEDGAEPGKKSPQMNGFKGLQPDQRRSNATFDSFGSYNDNNDSTDPLSPAAASSNFHHSNAHSLKSPLSASTSQQKFDFMSIDPTTGGAGNYSSALESSNVYSRNDEKRLSTATVGTLGTMNTTASDYVLSKPQIMTLKSPAQAASRSTPNTPASAVPRKMGSPALVKGSGSKPQVLKNLAQAKERGLLRISPRGTPIEEDRNPFEDVQEEDEEGFRSEVSSLAPRVRNPFHDDQASELEVETDLNGFNVRRNQAGTPNTFGNLSSRDEDEDEMPKNHRFTQKSFTSSVNRDSTGTFQTVGSGFSIPFIDVGKSESSPLRNMESNSPRDEKGGGYGFGFDEEEEEDEEGQGRRSGWLEQAPANNQSGSGSKNRLTHTQITSKQGQSSGSNLIRKGRGDERSSMISNVSDSDLTIKDEDVVINSVEKVSLGRSDSAKKLEYDGNGKLSRNNSSNQKGVGRSNSTSTSPSTSNERKNLNDLNGRQSTASSIGGLSLFDDVTFVPFKSDKMPENAAQNARSHQSSNLTGSNSLDPNRNLNSPIVSPRNFDDTFDEDLDGEEFLREVSKKGKGRDDDHDERFEGAMVWDSSTGSNGNSNGNKMINTGANPEHVEQIRLAHELSNYPFQMG